MVLACACLILFIQYCFSETTTTATTITTTATTTPNKKKGHDFVGVEAFIVQTTQSFRSHQHQKKLHQLVKFTTTKLTMRENRYQQQQLFISEYSSQESSESSDHISSVALFDRFRAVCPADISSIELFEPTLLQQQSPTKTTVDNRYDDVWVAVYRSNNNQPSILRKDEFLHAMRAATTTTTTTPSPSSPIDGINGFMQSKEPMITTKITTPNGRNGQSEKPVAVARLRKIQNPSSLSSPLWQLESMRCILKKETIDPSCDGGSEHTEAIATAIDSLLIYYLQMSISSSTTTSSSRTNDDNEVVIQKSIGPILEGTIRARATLVSSPLLVQRGFEEVKELQKDMTTHLSTIDGCFQMYAARSISNTISPATRQRSIDIVSLVGQINRNHEVQNPTQTSPVSSSTSTNEATNGNDDGDEYDPWAGMKKFI